MDGALDDFLDATVNQKVHTEREGGVVLLSRSGTATYMCQYPVRSLEDARVGGQPTWSVAGR